MDFDKIRKNRERNLLEEQKKKEKMMPIWEAEKLKKEQEFWESCAKGLEKNGRICIKEIYWSNWTGERRYELDSKFSFCCTRDQLIDKFKSNCDIHIGARREHYDGDGCYGDTGSYEYNTDIEIILK